LGFWSDSIFPRFLDWVARDNRELRELRTRALLPAQGRVLELGFGTGLNLPHYPQSVQAIVAVDPNPGMAAIARRRMHDLGMAVTHHRISAESLPFDSGSFDSVVSTLTLCSIPDVHAALGEVRRVLRPGGQFLFMEHGRDPDPRVAKWQDRLNPLWKAVFDGCQVNRDISQLIRHAGLTLTAIENPRMHMPRVAAYGYLGRAERPAD